MTWTENFAERVTSSCDEQADRSLNQASKDFELLARNQMEIWSAWYLDLKLGNALEKSTRLWLNQTSQLR